MGVAPKTDLAVARLVSEYQIRIVMNESRISQFYLSMLTDIRRRDSAGPSGRNLAMQAASDRGRVLFSAAFRRLQSKTQAFPQEWNASVRTRLTHSLEVASIGRYLAEKISEQLFEKGMLGEKNNIETLYRTNAFISFVEVSCLMHDLGNPPFGHFGEESIQEWFAARIEKHKEKFSKYHHSEFTQLYQDFTYFDGNPQGFRMATRLQWNKDEFGYNLTYSQLSATLKYPWTPERIGEIQDGKTVKKSGVFHSEKKILSELQSKLNMNTMSRHPLSYIMEAADDISYCLSDIEDALEKNIVRCYDVVFALRTGLGELNKNRIAMEILNSLPLEHSEDPAWFTAFRTTVTNVLVDRSCQLYIRHHAKIEAGEYFSLLDKSKAAKALLDIIRKFSKEHLYSSAVIRERELVGFQVVTGILDRFGLLLDLSSNDAEQLLINKVQPKATGAALASTLQSFLPRKHIKVYEHTLLEIRKTKNSKKRFELLEWIARAHLIVDYLSGMTDDFAIVTYRRLYGGGANNI